MTLVFIASAVVFAGAGAIAHLKYGASHSDAIFVAFGTTAALATCVVVAVSIAWLLR